MESWACQSRSWTSTTQSNLNSLQCQQCQDGQLIIGQCLTASQNIQEFLSKRYCSGIMGVPITFLDKYNPGQFEIVGQGQGNLYRLLNNLGLSKKFVDDYYKSGQKGLIKENHPVLGYYNKNKKPVIPYMRILVRKR